MWVGADSSKYIFQGAGSRKRGAIGDLNGFQTALNVIHGQRNISRVSQMPIGVSCHA